MLDEYPRPQLARESYLSLNGEWGAEFSKFPAIPSSFSYKIIVPFSPESKLSGVNRQLMPDEYLFYRKELEIPFSFIKDKVILHFGAVDQIADVFVNGSLVCSHEGGYLPFECDIKPCLSTKNEIIVRVRDYSDSSYLTRGKQKLARGGIYYTAQSGIYMPVWLESVSEDYVSGLKITPDIDLSLVTITILSSAETATVTLGGKTTMVKTNKPYNFSVESPVLWSPENPYLYSFTVSTKNDTVSSYFAMRKFSRMKDEKGFWRLALNNKPLFMKGVLDQGYYEDGIMTPSSDQDYINDIKLAQSLGFNCIRKHEKIESLRWYYHCDRLGMIVWQDFVSGGGKYRFCNITFPLFTRVHHKDNNYRRFARTDKDGREKTITEFRDTIALLYNCPCIALWTIFNEGWGQFDAAAIYQEMQNCDSTRLYDHASGWHDQGVSDVKSQHIYFQKAYMPKKKTIKDRAVVISEIGGYAFPVAGHLFSNKSFGYKKTSSPDSLIREYEKFMRRDILPLIPKGLSAFIYTQISDVEDEVNGFVTYDRKIVKVSEEAIRKINALAELSKSC